MRSARGRGLGAPLGLEVEEARNYLQVVLDPVVDLAQEEGPLLEGLGRALLGDPTLRDVEDDAIESRLSVELDGARVELDVSEAPRPHPVLREDTPLPARGCREQRGREDLGRAAVQSAEPERAELPLRVAVVREGGVVGVAYRAALGLDDKGGHPVPEEEDAITLLAPQELAVAPLDGSGHLVEGAADLLELGRKLALDSLGVVALGDAVYAADEARQGPRNTPPRE
jgi:hypothetical protein